MAQRREVNDAVIDTDDDDPPAPRAWATDPLRPERRLACAVLATAITDWCRVGCPPATDTARFLMAPGHPLRELWAGLAGVDADWLAERCAALRSSSSSGDGKIRTQWRGPR